MDDSVIVSADWLAAHRDDPEVRIIDVRDPWEFDGIGHIPGAVNIPFDEYRDDSDIDRGKLPGPAVFGELLSRAGVEPGHTLIAYDDTHGVFAARFVLTAIEYGHEDVRLLDGDYSAWARGYATATDSTDFAPTEYEPAPLSPAESPLIDRAAVEARLGTDTLFIDTREEHEFAEAHLPGAIRFDWREVVDSETRGLKPEDEIEARLRADGITRDRSIVLYCNTARRISHTYIVLRALGFEDVAFYEGSLTEWLAEGGEVATDVESA